ncbi:MAG: hypothetical protein HY581_04480 [Nitrospirae bacterium]|nr:hypothetical protein [Nitrospirota bacterium]
MQPSVPLIICFGDSLTVGYQSPTADFPALRETPYGAFLQERLGPSARVAVSGVCGELTGEMVMRFREDVLQHTPSYVVVLGGTNDLGWNASPDAIMRNLLKIYELAQSAGVRPVAVTVPSIRAEGYGGGVGQQGFVRHIARRQELNRLITGYCSKKGLACVDLFAATLEPETQRLAAPYSNDGLHLTTEGYQRLATLLYEQVFADRFHRSRRLTR